MDSSNLPVGQATERSGSGRNNLPGVYIQKLSGTKLITSEGNEGVIQADAFVRLGYEYAGPRPSRLELLEAQKTQEIKDAKAEKEEKEAFEAAVNKK